jgi:hypothetical protein
MLATLVNAQGLNVIAVQLLLSLVSGGLAGGFVSAMFNRIFHWRALRTQFYPQLTNILSAYVIRMEQPEGRYWINTVGNNPAEEDRIFVEHRADFILDLVKFSELKEARELRRKLLENRGHGLGQEGTVMKTDLLLEQEAILECFHKVHKKLKLP